MKRNFVNSDESIPPLVFELFPECKEKLQQIREYEDEIETVLSKKKRMSVAMNSVPAIKPKILRVYIRHEFHPLSTFERAYFIITIEGQVLERSSNVGKLPLGYFFEKIRIQLDKRFHPQVSGFEWSADNFPQGSTAQCFRMKFYGDKPSPVKIFLHRTNNDIRPRKELTPMLKDILPFLHADPAADEVLLAMLQYLEAKGLIMDRRIKLTQELRILLNTNGEFMSISNLAQNLAPHLLPCRPIQVDYYLTNTSTTVAMDTPSPNFSAPVLARGGGKAFDLQVDVKDPFAYQMLQIMNSLTMKEKRIQVSKHDTLR